MKEYIRCIMLGSFNSTADMCGNYDKPVGRYIEQIKNEELLGKLRMNDEEFYKEAVAGVKKLEQKPDRIMDSILNSQRNVPNPVPSENHNKPVDAQKLLQRELSGSKQLQAEKPKAEKSHDKIIIEDEPIIK